MALTIFWFIAGLTLLIFGAELLVRSSSRLAASVGISKLVIGLTVVAFGTSAPELAVGIEAGLNDQSDILLGNVIGSNLTNTLLILGLSALIIPLKVHKNLIRFDLPVMIGSTILLIFLAYNNVLSTFECLVLIFFLFAYLVALVRFSGKTDFTKKETLQAGSPWLNLLFTVIGLVMLIAGARWLVESATIFAEMAGVSELVIGLTVVAIGTSLPEIVTSVFAALKGEKDLAVGSIVGSNILNILSVIGISGLFIPEIPVQEALIRVDLMVLLGISVLCLPFFYSGKIINRTEGAILFTSYLLYLAYLYLDSVQSNLLEIFTDLIFYAVIPAVTIYALGAVVLEVWRRGKVRSEK
ncbi:sodium:calcium antiporter [Rhodohalobacter sp. SW132]|uniref:calcium/sodium antiporter n=1 Tax=Rhodohalobacter sp. SW132 TaxID=2293433 RepID=UPI000E286D56|nr:calcium/sodium antiporter [Rhodohalobacter sp. SW132]REL38821.1 sodium:calcium antiporter [Rhodohalobacter sp. SW132]